MGNSFQLGNAQPGAMQLGNPGLAATPPPPAGGGQVESAGSAYFWWELPLIQAEAAGVVA